MYKFQNKIYPKNLVVDYLSFNLEGSMDPERVAHRLLKYFTPDVLMDDVLSIRFRGLKKRYKVSVRKYMESKGGYTFYELACNCFYSTYYYNYSYYRAFNNFFYI